MPTNHYEVLELERTASPEEIKGAYRKLIRQVHPDRMEAERAQATTTMERRIIERQIREAHQRTQAINLAYDVLSDPEKRRQYDLTLPPIQAKKPAYTAWTPPAPHNPAPRSAPQNTPSDDFTYDPKQWIRRGAWVFLALVLMTVLCEWTARSLNSEPAIPTESVPVTATAYADQAMATRAALGIHPQPTGILDTMLVTALDAFEQEDYDSAIELLTRAISQEPRAEMYYLRGLAFRNRARGITSDDIALARADFSQVIVLNPDDADAYYQRGLIYYDQWRILAGDDNQRNAERDLQAALQLGGEEQFPNIKIIINQLQQADDGG